MKAEVKTTITSRDILGIEVANFDWDSAFAFFERSIHDRDFVKLSWLNAHNANVAFSDAAFKSALNGFLILPDGIGVDIASKVFYGEKFAANLNGTDFIPALLAHIQRPLKIGLLGGKPGVADAALAAFKANSPQHEYRVISHGYFKPNEAESLLNDLREFRADILLVAMGVPQQEFFIQNHITVEHCTIACGVGALLDFMSGRVERAPQWVRKFRMEWAYRLILEPKRLAKRYLLGNPLFLWRVFKLRLAGAKN